MRRREFLVLLGSAAAALPVAAAAQPDKVPRVGILVLGTPDPARFLKEFGEGLRELGYVEGRNVVFEFRSGKGSPALLATLAHELVALKVDLILTYQTPAATAAKQATAEIPIVLGSAGDPVGTGLIASLARPGGNVTGIAAATAELSAKNLELIREVLPAVRRVAVLANAPDPFHKPFLASIEAAGQSTGIEIKPILVRGGDELERAFSEMEKQRAEAVIVQPSLPHRTSAEMALRHRLPALAPSAEFTVAGGMMSYSADYPAMFREAAVFVDKIIKGRKPADLPVQLPTKFHLIVSLKTANALGLTLPPTLLTRADQVIE